ncbi:MAG: hypothetical protein CM1200mP22_23720 [Dehalococcoidia bacterium]|nr:MAG: hypothetical protein CM1200mP22_23720 [Dehalococcoidia bacterium]
MKKYGKYVLVTQHEVDLAEDWFKKYGELTVFASRMLPVLRGFISVPAGIARMNFWKFSFYTFVGSYPWSLGLAYGGFKLGENWEEMRHVMRPFDYLSLESSSWLSLVNLPQDKDYSGRRTLVIGRPIVSDSKGLLNWQVVAALTLLDGANKLVGI